MRAVQNDAKLSHWLPAEMDVWRCAEDSELVIAGVHDEKRLDDNYAVQLCPPDTALRPDTSTSTRPAR
jgi:hypothetical protein